MYYASEKSVCTELRYVEWVKIVQGIQSDHNGQLDL